MPRLTDEDVTLLQIIHDGVALNEAALELDWEEARFRCGLIAAKTAEAGHMQAGLAAVHVLGRLGPPGSSPRDGYADAMHRLCIELNAIHEA